MLGAFTLNNVNAQATLNKEVKAKVSGPQKLLYKADKKIVIEGVAISFYTSSWVAQGDATSGVGIAGYLALDSSMIQEISDEAYAYLEEKLAENGFEVDVYNIDKIKATKSYPKATKKGLIVADGGIYGDTPKTASKGDSWIASNANGVVTIWQPGVAPMGPAKIKMELNSGVDRIPLSLNATFAFTKNKSGFAAGGGIGTNAVKMEPLLSMTGGLATNYISGSKVVLVNTTGPAITYGNEDWIGEVHKQDQPYGQSLSYTADPVKFKDAALEMVKLYIDNAVSAFVGACTNPK